MVPRITMSLVHDDDKDVIRTNGGDDCERRQYRFNGSIQTVSKGKHKKQVLNRYEYNECFKWIFSKYYYDFRLNVVLQYLGYDAACEEGPGIFAHLLTFFSIILIIITLPVSLLWVVKVVQVRFCYRL